MSLLINNRAHNRQQIEESVRSYLSTLDDYDRWKDMFQSSVGKVLIETLCGITELLIYKADVRLVEQYLYTAMSRESLYLIADMLGYNVNRKSAAEGSVLITFKSPVSSQITIADGTVLYESETPLVAKGNHVVNIGETSKVVEVVQGEFVTQLLTATPDIDYKLNDEVISNITIEGTSYERVIVPEGFEIENANVTGRIQLFDCSVDDEYNLTVGDKIKWYKSVIDLDNVSVLIRTYYQGGITLLFGDGIYGKRLRGSSLVLLRYLKTVGLSVSIPANTQLGEVYLASIDGLVEGSMVVSETVTGGADEDDTEKVRFIVAGYLSAQERAVTIKDWVYIVLSYQGVISTQVRKADNFTEISDTFTNLITKAANNELITSTELVNLQELTFQSCCTVEVVALTQSMSTTNHYDWSNPETYWEDSIRESAIREYLENYKMVSTNVVFKTPIPKDLAISLTVTVPNLTINTEEVVTSIKSTIREYCYKLQGIFTPTKVIKEVGEIDASISVVEIISLRINGIVVEDRYAKIELAWEEYFRNNEDEIVVSFITSEV